MYTIYRSCQIIDNTKDDQVVVATTDDRDVTMQLLDQLRAANTDKLYFYFALDSQDQSIESK